MYEGDARAFMQLKTHRNYPLTRNDSASSFYTPSCCRWAQSSLSATANMADYPPTISLRPSITRASSSPDARPILLRMRFTGSVRS